MGEVLALFSSRKAPNANPNPAARITRPAIFRAAGVATGMGISHFRTNAAIRWISIKTGGRILTSG
jgi:hypothetical protein